MDIKKELPGVKENVLLKNFTTFRIGGKAKYFFQAKSKEELIKAIFLAKKFKLPFFILGGGSNLLVSDKGYNGIVIRFQISDFRFQKNKIIAGAGTPLAILVSEAAKNSLTGLEWAVGIPGTVGGAIWGDAGAFGSCMADLVESVEVLDIGDYKIPNSKIQIPNKFQIPKFKIKILKNKDCKFGYRESIFKYNKNLIILSAKIRLKRGKKSEIKRKIKEFLNYRKQTQPLNFPSAGSVFKNYELRIEKYELIKKFPEIKNFVKKGQIPAGWLIEKCGLKGKRIGKAKISEKHSNFIVNLGGAKAKDVKDLIDFTKKKVKKIFGITLEEEIQYLGFEK
jgi:UDP-N-acetylmuramate dehydrogenase